MLSAFKNFAITLIIAAVVFGVIAYFATQFVTATVSDILGSEMSDLNEIISGSVDSPDEGDTSESDEETVVIPPEQEVEGNSFAFLVLCSGYRPDLFSDYLPTIGELQDKVYNFSTAADSFGILSKQYRENTVTSIVLVRADKERREYTYTYITPETRVHTTTGYHTLAEVYTLYGVDSVSAHVRSLTGIRPTYTFLLEGYNMEEFIALLGEVPVYLAKNIYAEGKYHTTRSETTREYVNEDGDTIVDHFGNSMVLGSGNITFSEYSSFILNTLKERSSAEIDLKSSYSVALVEAYIRKLAAMTEEEFIAFIEKVLAVPELTEETVVPSEPLTPILQTNFTAENIPTIFGMLQAAGQFESSVLSYPGTYVQETEEEGAHFEPDLTTAIKRFLPYRIVVTE